MWIDATTATTLPSTNVADVWIGFAGLAFTILSAAAVMAFRLGRLTESVRNLKDDMAATESRVERMLMRAWVQIGEEEHGRQQQHRAR